MGYIIKGITSDGNTGLESAIKTLFPDISHQHCLVHLQRSCQTFLTQNPETDAGKQLLELVQCINTIKDKANRNVWLKWFYRIEARNKDVFNQTTRGISQITGKPTWWYTHKYLRRAYRSIKQAIPNMFLYLDYPNLSKDTNGLEGEFSHFKSKVTAHWGLKRQRKVNLVKWYFYLKSRDGIS